MGLEAVSVSLTVDHVDHENENCHESCREDRGHIFQERFELEIAADSLSFSPNLSRGIDSL